MRILYLAVLFLLLSFQSVFANETEINHLLHFIEQSNCSFIRNGDLHTPAEAREHIEKKYQYLKKKIRTTRQFIDRAASRSSISKKTYSVICDGQQMTSAQWLEDELVRYRKEIAEQ